MGDIMTYEKREKAFSKFKQNLKQEVINALQQAFSETPIDWRKVVDKRIIEKLYTSSKDKAFKHRDFTSDLPFDIKLHSVEGNKRFIKFMNSEDYERLKAIDAGSNTDLHDFICILFLLLGDEIEPPRPILTGDKDSFMSMRYGSQLGTFEYKEKLSIAKGRPKKYNLKIFVDAIEHYRDEHNLYPRFKKVLLFKVISYFRGYDPTEPKESARVMYRRLKKWKALGYDYDKLFELFLKKKLALIKEINPSAYKEIRNKINQIQDKKYTSGNKQYRFFIDTLALEGIKDAFTLIGVKD
jgi:hypothetical protein